MRGALGRVSSFSAFHSPLINQSGGEDIYKINWAIFTLSKSQQFLPESSTHTAEKRQTIRVNHSGLSSALQASMWREEWLVRWDSSEGQTSVSPFNSAFKCYREQLFMGVWLKYDLLIWYFLILHFAAINLRTGGGGGAGGSLFC